MQRILLDTNVWRHLIDADGVDRLRKSLREEGATCVVAPGVVYEMLRTPGTDLRRRLVRAATLHSWPKLMPEVFLECRDLRAVLQQRRPEWLIANPDAAYYFRLQADWSQGGDFWRRARREPEAEARRLASLEGGLMDLAREEARHRRTEMSNVHFDQVQPTGWTARPVPAIPGWNGEPVDAWRLMSAGTWWDALVQARRQPYLDWIGPFVDTDQIARSFESWNQLWLHEVTDQELTREWLRWAVMLLQSVRKVTPGTPADNQIALYAYESDLFLSGDKAIVEILNRVAPFAPGMVASARLVVPGVDPVEQIVDSLAAV